MKKEAFHRALRKVSTSGASSSSANVASRDVAMAPVESGVTISQRRILFDAASVRMKRKNKETTKKRQNLRAMELTGCLRGGGVVVDGGTGGAVEL